MKKAKKAENPIRKIIGICLILLFVMGVGVMASNAKLYNVKIILSNGYIMNVTTSKTKVSEILDENHIILLPEESVIPNEDSELSDNKTIKISKDEQQTVEVAENAEISENVTVETLLKTYDSIVEKLETVQVTIPYETITKDVSNNDSNKRETVVQKGKDGLKEVTYKIKYQNEVEIEKIQLSEKIIREPVNKIVQVNKTVTSRSGTTPSTTVSSNASGQIYKITAYCPCAKCCGKATGRTAMGTKATAGRTVAASAQFAFGTKLNINGHTYTVEDRGGAIKGNKIDIFVNSHAEALAWGVRYLPVSVINQ